MNRFTKLAALAVILFSGAAVGQDQLQMPEEIREWYRNPDGSCVQCSIGIAGVWHNVPAASMLLWDTPYGPRVRGGSGPARVEAYCDQRQIPAWNITGKETWDWMMFAATTGRMIAIGAGSVHFQTLCYYDREKQIWWVCNNNSPERFDPYTPAAFRRLHLASGQWVVLLKAPPPPVYPNWVEWWK